MRQGHTRASASNNPFLARHSSPVASWCAPSSTAFTMTTAEPPPLFADGESSQHGVQLLERPRRARMPRIADRRIGKLLAGQARKVAVGAAGDPSRMHAKTPSDH